MAEYSNIFSIRGGDEKFASAADLTGAVSVHLAVRPDAELMLSTSGHGVGNTPAQSFLADLGYRVYPSGTVALRVSPESLLQRVRNPETRVPANQRGEPSLAKSGLWIVGCARGWGIYYMLMN